MLQDQNVESLSYYWATVKTQFNFNSDKIILFSHLKENY